MYVHYYQRAGRNRLLRCRGEGGSDRHGAGRGHTSPLLPAFLLLNGCADWWSNMSALLSNAATDGGRDLRR
jgi:hypothetical protein